MNLERAFAYVGAATLGAAACLLFVVANDSHADPFTDPGVIDRTLPYEGVLEIDGTEVMSGTHTFDFALYDGPESDGGAVQLWPVTGWAREDLDVRAGRFAVQIGASDGPLPGSGFESLPDAVFEADQLYLAIQVDDALLSGRQRINTVPWSVRSAHALHASSATGQLATQIVPPGMIGPFAGPEANVPEGWLPCDGRGLHIDDYPELAATLETTWGDGTENCTAGPGNCTFNLPDMRGQFLRGANGDVGADPDATQRVDCDSGVVVGDRVGSCQRTATKLPVAAFGISGGDHHHGIPYTTNVGAGQSNVGYGGTGPFFDNVIFTRTDGHSHAINSGGDNESRPSNVAIHWIVKH